MTKKNVPEGDHPIASDRSMAKWIAIGFAFGVIVGNIALWTLFGVAIGAASVPIAMKIFQAVRFPKE